jgi:hypothetical protein
MKSPFRQAFVLVSLLALPLSACNCDDPVGGDDGGSNGGADQIQDAGADAPDSGGSEPDAGPLSDAGVPMDAGERADAAAADSGVNAADSGRVESGDGGDGGDGGDAGPRIYCNSRADCPGDWVCAGIEPLDGGLNALYCIASFGTEVLGGNCATEFLNATDQCETGLCDDDVSGRCYEPCVNDGECGVAAGWICTGSGFSNFPDYRFCGEPCIRHQDCGAERACRRKIDRVDNYWELSCDGTLGDKAAGTVVTFATECESALAIERDAAGGGLENVCTQFCTPPSDGGSQGQHADCPSAAPVCRSISVPLPNGGGNQDHWVCQVD